ncbi:MAG: glycosyltransferase family 4 protein [Bacteroidales bacterium]|nr:glycosyltransferase family 4 protein [Bacteroidales bacterium]
MFRILHIIPRLRKGGAERLCLDICNELQKRENTQVQLITFSEENAYPFLTESLDWKIVPACVKLSVFHKNQYFVESLQRAIEDFAPAVIHTHLFEAEVVSRSVFYPQAKWFSHCHDNMKQFKSFKIKTVLNKELFTNYFERKHLLQRYKANGGNTFIAISKDTEAYFKQNVDDLETVLLPNAIDYRRFYRKTNKTNSDCLRLVHVGSFTANKNQKFLVEVASILQSRNILFELHFLGAGECYKEVENLVIEKQLQHQVVMHGNIANVEEYLWQSDLYVHSSFSEALGLTLIEAMAAGLPIVTLDGKGNRDLVEEGKNGYMVYEQNPELFADKILEIWNDKQKYQEMSLYAQEFAKRYDIVPYVDRLFEIYSEK